MAEHYLFNGKIKQISETQSFTNFRKREFVVTETDNQYPSDIKFEFIGDNADVMDNYNVNDSVTVAFVLKGNEYNGKYYTNLRAIAIGPLTSSDSDKKAEVETKGKGKQTLPKVTNYDLPF